MTREVKFNINKQTTCGLCVRMSCEYQSMFIWITLTFRMSKLSTEKWRLQSVYSTGKVCFERFGRAIHSIFLKFWKNPDFACIFEMEKEVHRTKDVEIIKNVPFSDMMLSKSVLAGLKTCNFEFPSPIQLRAIPIGRCGSGTTKLEKKRLMFFEFQKIIII